jgi:hypothetical protein
VGKLRQAAATHGHVDPRILPQAYSDMSGSFQTAFVVGTILVAVCLVPALLLPRRRPERTMDPAAMVH